MPPRDPGRVQPPEEPVTEPVRVAADQGTRNARRAFALLFALNHLDLSLVAPASASLTLVTNAVAGKLFLHENVDRRRWTAALLVCIGVYLLAH